MNQPEIIPREAFRVMGTLTRIEPGAESPEAFGSIWKEFEARQEEIQRHSADPRFYGVSFSSVADRTIHYLAGMAVGTVERIPEGLVVREIPAATYAVFACPVQAIGQTYRYIFGQWCSTSDHKPDPARPAFEQYPPATEPRAPVEIHIPVQVG